MSYLKTPTNSFVCLAVSSPDILGDVVLVQDEKPDGNYIGSCELKKFIWLHMRDVPEKVASDKSGSFRIPLDRLAWLRKLIPYDIDRILDIEDGYQPFVYLATRNPSMGDFITGSLLIDSYGLILNKRTGIYI